MLKLGRIFATFGYKPAQMTALSNFSLSVKDSKVSNAVLQIENLTQKLSVSFYCLPELVLDLGSLGSLLFTNPAARRCSANCPFMLCSIYRKYKLSQNDAVPKGSSPSPTDVFVHFQTIRMLPGVYLKTGNIPSSSLSQFWIHGAESLPSPRNSYHSSKAFKWTHTKNINYIRTDQKNVGHYKVTFFSLREKANPFISLYYFMYICVCISTHLYAYGIEQKNTTFLNWKLNFPMVRSKT